MELKRILVPTDFSESADYAFQYALTFAREFGATLYVLHVVYFPAHTAPQSLRLPQDATSQVLDGLVKEAKQSLKKLIERTNEPGVIVPPLVRVGVDYIEITAFAEQEQIDLIVMGTHGRTGLAHAFLGSVAERVVRHAPCPVLTVKLPASKRQKAVEREWVSRSDLRHW